MNLSLFIFIPLLTAVIILLCKGLKQVRVAAFAGSLVQVGLSIALLLGYWKERKAGNSATMLFEADYVWFAPLNIHYHIGVDGISIAMILLTSLVVIAGVLVSWITEWMGKEFFFPADLVKPGGLRLFHFT